MINLSLLPQHSLVFDSITNEMFEKQFAVYDGFISPEYAFELRSDILKKFEEGEFNKAKIGNLLNTQKNEQIRTDFIHWYDMNTDEVIYQALFAQLKEFGKWLNKFCYTNINDIEIHSAIYPEGSFYKKHLDAFTLNNKRVFTFILYLNLDWQESSGGQLRIHQDEGQIDIAPIQGRLVFFEASKVPHEVLVSNFDRISITGWFRRDELILDRGIFNS